ncbi:MAG: hypothetical protein JSV88_20600 [Candidatus Aminicenantes bacterium]|nr:MAG: hypothetical protein JSV88_20600 [Candidatus Aminicenantes bacterium]
MIIQLTLSNHDKKTPNSDEEKFVAFYVGTPEDAKVGEHEKDVKVFSDKNALARNRETIPDLDIGEPYAKGDFKSYALPKKNGVQDEKVQRPVPLKILKKEGEAKKELVNKTISKPLDLTARQGSRGDKKQETLNDKKVKKGGEGENESPNKSIYRLNLQAKTREPLTDKKDEGEADNESVIGSKQDLKIKGGARLASYGKDPYNRRQVFELPEFGVTPHDHQQSRVVDIGVFSLDTVYSDLARYLQVLKKRIKRNIHPPGDYKRLKLRIKGETRLSIKLKGETLLRLKIYRNGTLKDLEILEHKGHKSLEITSANAIKLSAPFPRLPQVFTGPYLELTVKITYLK